MRPTANVDKNAFGNYRQLLKGRHSESGMGHYLDADGNSRVAPNAELTRENHAAILGRHG